MTSLARNQDLTSCLSFQVTGSKDNPFKMPNSLSDSKQVKNITKEHSQVSLVMFPYQIMEFEKKVSLNQDPAEEKNQRASKVGKGFLQLSLGPCLKIKLTRTD